MPMPDLPLPPVAPLDPAAIGQVPSVSLRARYLAQAFLSGRHHSSLRGTAPEFAEYRAYQAGDDLRRIDWRLFGRSDRLAVKQFEDESQLRICLAFDVSASLRYASRPGIPTKSDYARLLLAAVGVIARRQNDAVGLAFAGDAGQSAEGDGALCDFLRPAAAPAHFADVLRRLDAPPAAERGRPEEALQQLGTLLRPGSLVVIASDFYVDLGALERALPFLRSRRVDVLGLQVLDPMEVDFDLGIAGRYVDLEEGSVAPLDAAACRAGYLERFRRYQAELEGSFRRHAAVLARMRTDEPPLTALASCLAERSRAIR